MIVARSRLGVHFQVIHASLCIPQLGATIRVVSQPIGCNTLATMNGTTLVSSRAGVTGECVALAELSGP